MRINSFLAVSALALAGWSAGASANLITNGSFETGPAVNGVGYVNLPTGSDTITGWEVTSGNIDYIGSYWTASNGAYSLDLSGTGSGSISQTVSLSALDPGKEYLLSFALAGNPQGGPKQKDLQVTIANGVDAPVSQVFEFDTTGKSTTAMGWDTRTLFFTPTAAGRYTFTFTSLNDDRFGAALDNVRLTVIPIPPAALLFLSGLAGLALIAKRRKSANGSGPLAA